MGCWAVGAGVLRGDFVAGFLVAAAVAFFFGLAGVAAFFFVAEIFFGEAGAFFFGDADFFLGDFVVTFFFAAFFLDFAMLRSVLFMRGAPSAQPNAAKGRGPKISGCPLKTGASRCRSCQSSPAAKSVAKPVELPQLGHMRHAARPGTVPRGAQIRLWGLTIRRGSPKSTSRICHSPRENPLRRRGLHPFG